MNVQTRQAFDVTRREADKATRRIRKTLARHSQDTGTDDALRELETALEKVYSICTLATDPPAPVQDWRKVAEYCIFEQTDTDGKQYIIGTDGDGAPEFGRATDATLWTLDGAETFCKNLNSYYHGGKASRFQVGRKVW